MQHLERYQHPINNIKRVKVGRQLRGVDQSAANITNKIILKNFQVNPQLFNDPQRENAQAGDDPQGGENAEADAADEVVVGVFCDFRRFEEDVAAVVHHEHQRAHPTGARQPREGDEEDGGDVVHEHLPEVFAFYVEELAEEEGHVEGEGDHVVPPEAAGDHLGVRVVDPATKNQTEKLADDDFVPRLRDVPKPRLIPQHHHAIHENARIVRESPTTFTKLD